MGIIKILNEEGHCPFRNMLNIMCITKYWCRNGGSLLRGKLRRGNRLEDEYGWETWLARTSHDNVVPQLPPHDSVVPQHPPRDNGVP